MPSISLKISPPLSQWTKVPNELFDRLLPVLSDTELRLLMALIRYAFGWKYPRLHADFSYQELERLTGRKEDALQKALATLSQKGLLSTGRSQGPRIEREVSKVLAGLQTNK